MTTKLSQALSALPSHTVPADTDDITVTVNGHGMRLPLQLLRQIAAEDGRIDVKLGASNGAPRAKGDGTTDDTAAVLAALAAVEAQGGGTLYFPPGVFCIHDDLMPTTTVRIRGCGQDISTLFFKVEGKTLRLGLDALGNPGDRNPVHSDLASFTIRNTPRSIPVVQANHDYAVGDRFRSVKTPLAQGNIRDVDIGLHFVCTVAGRTPADVTSPEVIPTNHPGVSFVLGETQDPPGTATFQCVDWSGLSVSVPFVRVDKVNINAVTDSGLFVHGGSGGGIADESHFTDLRIVGGDGHGIFISGEDGNNCQFDSIHIQEFHNGNGAYDTGFLSNHWKTIRVVNCRRSFHGAGNAWSSIFEGCYQENCEDLAIIQSPSFWFSGANGHSSDPRMNGFFDNKISPAFGGQSYEAAPQLFQDTASLVRTIGGTASFEAITRTASTPATVEHPATDDRPGGTLVADPGSLVTTLVTNDADDPIGYLREAWAGSAYAVAYDRLLVRSAHAPGKLRFPQGFYLGQNFGDQVAGRITRLSRVPGPDDVQYTGTRLWRPEDLVINTRGGSGQPLWWRPNRKGGWGGGILYGGGRTWVPGLFLRIDEGIEPTTPTTPTAFVFRAKWLEIETAPGVWARDATKVVFALPASEPAWSTAPMAGNVVYSPLVLGSLIPNETHRIVWENFAEVGMAAAWDVGPLPSGTTSS